MNLAELDRIAITWHYDRWDQDITFRPIDAKTFADLAAGYAEMDGSPADAPEALRFYAALLSATVTSHQATEDEWLEATHQTLQALGKKALEVNGLLAEEAKKN